jgi:hypothetical protein
VLADAVLQRLVHRQLALQLLTRSELIVWPVR